MNWLSNWLQGHVTALQQQSSERLLDRAVYHMDDCQTCQTKGALACPESRRLWALVWNVRQVSRYPGEE